MKKILLVVLLSTGCLLSSCQCSNPPDVPPVEDGQSNISTTVRTSGGSTPAGAIDFEPAATAS